jgi:tryptophanyl-tRNA synthetase
MAVLAGEFLIADNQSVTSKDPSITEQTKRPHMKQVATGIQTTGAPHLGNIVGAIRPAIAAGGASERAPVYVVADMHSMLSVQDPVARKENILRVTAAWMAFGASDRGMMYRQSRIPELSEIAMLLAGTADMRMAMEGELKAQVFASMHPVLMSADLLMLGTTHVPVGQDSTGHIEIVRDTAQRFNAVYGPVLEVPTGLIDRNRPTLPGVDGRKMSKSFGNTIDVLCPPDEIRARVNAIVVPERAGTPAAAEAPPVVREILTAMGRLDSLPDRASPQQAKDALADLLVDDFREERARFAALMADSAALIATLEDSEAQVAAIAGRTLDRMRVAMGMG